MLQPLTRHEGPGTGWPPPDGFLVRSAAMAAAFLVLSCGDETSSFMNLDGLFVAETYDGVFTTAKYLPLICEGPDTLAFAMLSDLRLRFLDREADPEAWDQTEISLSAVWTRKADTRCDGPLPRDTLRVTGPWMMYRATADSLFFRSLGETTNFAQGPWLARGTAFQVLLPLSAIADPLVKFVRAN